MNPLTFQMQISNSLETQIKHYTEELNKLLSIANGKEIKIGVSDSLTQLVAELQKGMLNITKAQNESVEAGKKLEVQTKAQADAIKAAAEAQARLNQLTKAHEDAMSKLSNLKASYANSLKEGAFVSEFMEIPNKIGKSLEAAAEKGKEYLKSIGKGWLPYTSTGSRGIKGAFYDLEGDKKAIEAVRNMFKWDTFERYRGKSIDDVKNYIETLKTLRQKLTNQGDYGMPEWKGYNLEINALESLIKLFQKCKEEQDKFLESNKGSKYIDALPKTENGEYKYITETYKKQEELQRQIAKAEHDEKDALSALNSEKAKQALLSQQSAQTKEKETQALEKNTSAKEKNAQTSSQPKQLELDFTKQTTKLTEFAENVERCIGRIRTSIESLTANMGKGIDNTAFVQSLTAFTQAMQPFADLVDKLSASSGKYQDVMQKLAASSKDLLASVQQVKNVENSVNSKTTGDAQKDAAEGMKQYINNVNKLEHALMRLDNAIAQAESDKARIAKNSGDTDKIKAYIDNLNNLREAILRAQQNPDMLGQKGTMFKGKSEELDGLIEKFKTAAVASKGTKEDIANILGLAREIGNKSPLGVDFIRGLGDNQNFTQYANKLEAAVPKLNVANEKTAESMARLDSVIGRSNGKGRVQELEQLKQKLQDFENSLSKLSAIDAAAKLDNGFTKLIQDIQKATNAQENLLSSMDKLSFYQKNVFGMLSGKDFNDRFHNMMERYNTLTNEQGNRFIENSGMRGPGGVFDSLIAFNKKIEEALKNPEILSQKGKVAELTMEFNKLSYAYHSCWSQAEKLASAQDRANKKSGGLTEAQIKIKEANDLYSAIVKKLTEYNSLIGKTGKFNIDTTDLEKAIAELEKFRVRAKAIADGKGVGADGETARQLRFSQGYVDASSKAEIAASSLKLQVASAKESESASRNLTAEQERLASAFQKATGAAQGQSQVFSDLKSLMYQYFSVYGAQQFLTEMANITGELELQKKSLEVILDSGTAASTMYSQIRDLSQQSPYTFEDLLKSHRQLAAFGVEGKDLYGTMKALSDIGAGLDVDVSRLILAYGHTKSYGYLSGIQNRQFETAGIDLVGGLTDYYNKRAKEDQANGISANFVTRKDIFKKMRDRSIPFEDVKSVILGLDQPGGKFYNMQERQFDTLGGKLRNLKNNYRIMMSEIGESNKGLLMGFVSVINNATENWAKYANAIKGVAFAYGILKARQMALGKFMLPQGVAVSTTIAQIKREAGITDFLNGYGVSKYGSSRGGNSGYTPAKVNTSAQISRAQEAAKKEIMNNKELTNSMKQRIALTSKLTDAQKVEILTQTGVAEAQAKYLVGLKGVRRQLLLARLAVRGFVASIAAMLPQMGIFAAIAAITALHEKTKQMEADAADFANTIRDNAKTDAAGIKETVEQYDDLYRLGTSNKASDTALFRAKADAQGASDVFDDLRKKLENQSPMYEGDYFDVMKANSQMNQLQEMFKKFKTLQKVKNVEQNTAGMFEDAMNEGSGWFTRGSIYAEDLKKNLEEYANERKDFVNRFSVGSMWKMLSAKEKRDIYAYANEIGEAMKDAESQKRVLANYTLRGGNAINKTTLYSVTKNYKDVEEGMKPFADHLASVFINSYGDDVDAMSVHFSDIMNQMIAGSKIADKATIDQITDQFLTELIESMQAAGESRKNIQGFIKQVITKSVGGDVAKLLEGRINDTMSQSEVNKAVKTAISKVKNSFSSSHIGLETKARLYGLSNEEIIKIVTEAANNLGRAMAATEPWQRRALKFKLGIMWDQGEDWSSYIDKVRKDLHDKASASFNKVMRFKTKFKLDLSFDIDAKNAIKRIAYLVNDVINPLIRRLWKQNPAKNKAIMEEINELRDFRGDLLKMFKEKSYLKEEGVGSQTQKDYDKSQRKEDTQKRKAEEAKRKAEAAAEKADRNDIKKFNDRINALGKARQMYEEWYNRYKDKDYAIAQVRGRMKSALDKGEYVKDSINADDFKKLDSLSALRDVLVKEQDIIGRWKPRTKNGKEQKNSMLANVESQINQLDTKEADKRLKEFADGTKRLTEQVSDAYETFKSVRDKTGDTDFAMELSRFRYKVDSGVAGFDWTENVNNLFSIVSSKLSEIGAQLFSTKDMEELYNLTGDNLKSRVSGMLRRNLSKKEGESDEEFEKRTGDMLNHVDAIVSIVEQFNSAMKNMVKAANETATELYTSSNTFKERKQKAQTQFEQNEKNIEREAFDENGNKYHVIGRQEDRARLHRKNSVLYDTNNSNGIARLLYDGEIQRMLNAPTTMRSSKVRQLAHTYISAFNDAFLNGFIDETKRNTEVDKAQKAMRASLKSTGNSLVGQMSFMGGLFFDPTKHTQDLQSMRNAATVQLSEQMALSQGEQDANLIAVLQRLVQALDNILSGVGGKSEIAAAARTQKNVSNWSKMKKGQQVKAGEKAKDEFSKNVNDPFGFWERSGEAVQNAMGKFISALSAGSQAVNLLSDTFDKLGLGDTGMGQAVSDASGVMSGMLSGASSLSALGPYGMAAGAALGLVGGIAQTHDKRLQRKIEKMQEDVSKIESYTQVISKAQERTLGYDYGHVIRSYQKMYNTGETNVSGSALGAMQQYYAAAGGGDITGYQQQYNLLVQKRRDYSDMYNAENKKKKKSKSSLEEYKSKIAELDDQIKYFSEDIAKNLYSIDLKSWADQLSDALMTAFENGDDAAEAFKNSVTSILQSLTKQMISLGVMQPLFDNLRNKLFGYTDSNGAVHKGSFDASHPDSNKDQWMSDISEALGKDGYIYNGVESSKILFDKMENLVEKSGNTLLNSGSSSAGSSIKGITEQTADLLASYLNAIRADVSVLRQLQSGKAADYMDSMSLMAQSQVQYQSQIAANTLRNAEAAEKIVTSNEEILYLFKAVTNDTKTVSTRVR